MSERITKRYLKKRVERINDLINGKYLSLEGENGRTYIRLYTSNNDCLSNLVSGKKSEIDLYLDGVIKGIELRYRGN